jgi:hypothetical protein
MAEVDMAKHEAVCAILDTDQRIVDWNAEQDQARLNPDDQKYDQAYELRYYNQLRKLRRQVAHELI